MAGLTLSSRLVLSTVKAMATEQTLKPNGAILLSDSECSISALDKTSSALKPYFHNRVCEVKENLKMTSAYCPLDEVYHIPGKHNIADLATHSTAKLSELGPDSEWQKGPSFLSCRRELWPITRNFVRVDLPENELRSVKSNKFAAMIVLCGASKISKTGVTVWATIQKIMEYSNNIMVVLRILAIVIRGWKLGKAEGVVELDPCAEELTIAERMMLMVDMPATYTALDKEKLDSLLPKKEGYMLVTARRIGKRNRKY